MFGHGAIIIVIIHSSPRRGWSDIHFASPEAALKTGSVDYILSPEMMPSTIERLVRGAHEEREEAESELEKEIDMYRESHP